MLYGMYKDGFLPEPGGINAQPALLVNYFNQLNMVNAKLDKEDLDRANNNEDDASSNAGGMRSILKR